MLLKLLLLLVTLAPVPAPPRPDPMGAGYLGVQAQHAADGHLKLPTVVAGTPADRAGLKVGDVLVKVGRHHPRQFEDLREYVSGLRPGTRVDVELRRNGRTMLVGMVVGAVPAQPVQVIDPFLPRPIQVVPPPPPNR